LWPSVSVVLDSLLNLKLSLVEQRLLNYLAFDFYTERLTTIHTKGPILYMIPLIS
jgi:hypothetical protein